ncbi:L-serine ammonia-lyase, iron-sulfur-dependent, subunit alpha [Acidobacteriota bacterium]
MEFISIFNDVLGPVMRGPSSSHTAGSFHIGTMARSLMNNKISSVTFTFDPSGSYAQVYRQQGVDLAFAVGIMGRKLTDEIFFDALNIAARQGIDIKFTIAPIKMTDHPNTVVIDICSPKKDKLQAVAKSVGGGVIRFTRLDDWEIELTGKAYEIVVICSDTVEPRVKKLLTSDGQTNAETETRGQQGKIMVTACRKSPLPVEIENQIRKLVGVRQFHAVAPVYYVKKGETLFSSAAEMVALTKENGFSLGQVALDYEAQLLGLSNEAALKEMMRRFEIMKESVTTGLMDEKVRMQLLDPTAGKISKAEAEKRLAIGGLHTRAAFRAMAAMHQNNSMGVVCAAPTGGSAGVLPGVVVTLAEEKKLSAKESAMALFAASAIGLIVARRATFAAEVAGCQVEIGAAGAMATAAVVEVAGDNAADAADAAAIAFQNTMGSVCDLVQGMCEIPCHTRNAVAASSAFVCADLILGGYVNPIPLDETIDAVYSVGKMLPPELRCTTLGGLAVTPSALSLKKKNIKQKF